MELNQDNYTYLALNHCDIQLSPAEVLQLNALPMIPFKHSLHNDNNFGYQIFLSGYSNSVFEREMSSDYANNLETSIDRLKSEPRPSNSHTLKGSTDTYSINSSYYRIDYRIYSGQITIFNIQLSKRYQNERDRQEKNGLYSVTKNLSGNWQVARKTDQVKTAYAAVNGQSNNLAKATWLMGSHLEFEFGDTVQEYSLFHNPSVGGPGDTWESLQDKLGFTTPVTQAFAKVLANTQQNGHSTDWLVHSQGAIIFSEAVRYLLNGNSSSAITSLQFNGLRHPERGSLLDKQRVALHGNANNNLRSGLLFKRAGVDVIAIRAHDYDLVSNIVGKNTVNPRKLLGSIVYANHVFNGSIAQSPHTTTQSMASWQFNMAHGPGRGRNPLQQALHNGRQAIDNTKDTVKALTNYLS
ncbi:hypothetical protein EDC56_2857 [Sinobacterium caligoides]|uniref:Uncharacterized protein n=1 Tax=Sinobacterium caligoides TaxID=933926 RepID=A0A3N2DKK4_9GAMM|nr:hypothetical protein [Sinobacterium caligoides]ROS00219.1 hypothetical protein EDC56_2857 [Sinobacterium caligoides]